MIDWVGFTTLSVPGFSLTTSASRSAGVATVDKLVLDPELDRRPLSWSQNVNSFRYPSDLKDFDRVKPILVSSSIRQMHSSRGVSCYRRRASVLTRLVRLCTLTLMNIERRWFCTVRALIHKRSAISGFVIPMLTSLTMSICRGVRLK